MCTSILESLDEHAIKRQACEAEKKKLIDNGHAWTVGQITWTAITDSAPTDPIPKHPICGIRGFDFEVFQTLKKELKANHHSCQQSHKEKHEFHKHENSRPYLKASPPFLARGLEAALAQTEGCIQKQKCRTHQVCWQESQEAQTSKPE
jgi:hypothetical protein